MSYGYVYVAQVAHGRQPELRPSRPSHEAEAYDGPSLIIGYSPCEMHGIKKGGMTELPGRDEEGCRVLVTGTSSASTPRLLPARSSRSIPRSPRAVIRSS